MVTPTLGMYMSLRKSLFQLLKCIYNTQYVYDDKLNYGPGPRSPGGITSLSPQVSVLIPRPSPNRMERMRQRLVKLSCYTPVQVQKPIMQSIYTLIHRQ